ncbi:MAG: 2-dehydropantoate 2-reductase [Clostridia bacterium]|nr:2-dehydropantoate 2-reductase [Clostridia bacterium]
MKKRIAVYGAGAMGTVLGAFLTAGGLEVDLISRNENHVEGLKKSGAIIECTAVEKEIKIPVKALMPEEMTGKYDVVFLMTKQRENVRTLTFLQDYLAEDGVVCTTQNGLPEESVASVLGYEKTYGAAVTFGAKFVGGGKVALTSAPKAMSIRVGGYFNDNSRAEELKEILLAGRVLSGNENFAEVTDNLAGARWSKLAVNGAFSGLSVVTGLTFGEIAKKKKTRKVALGLLREAILAAKAHGVQPEKMQGYELEQLFGKGSWFRDVKANFLLPIAIKNHAMLRSGMLADVQKGKKCEIDFICGVVATMAKKAGVEAPLSEKVVELVHGIENGLYEISYENMNFFEI